MPAFCPFEEYFLSALTIRAPLRLHFFSLSRFFFSSNVGPRCFCSFACDFELRSKKRSRLRVKDYLIFNESGNGWVKKKRFFSFFSFVSFSPGKGGDEIETPTISNFENFHEEKEELKV